VSVRGTANQLRLAFLSQLHQSLADLYALALDETEASKQLELKQEILKLKRIAKEVERV
jgi:hypothetical protein